MGQIECLLVVRFLKHFAVERAEALESKDRSLQNLLAQKSFIS